MREDVMNNIKIGYLPSDLKANTYIKENREILGRLGEVVKVPHPKDLLIQMLTQFLKTGSLVLYDILILNFRENAFRSNKNSISLIGSIEFFVSLLIHKLSCHKLIYVRHEIHPHNIQKKLATLSTKMIDLGQSIADKVVCLSPPYAKLNGCYYVPHPLYDIGYFLKKEVEKKAYFIVFGRIERYKNIDKIIKYIDKGIELIVMGPCIDLKYLEELKKLAGDKNIIFEVGFQSEEHLQKIISSSSGVIITNDASSMLVSGSFFYAISCGARVYTLETLFMEWVKSTSIGPYITVEPNVELLMKRIIHCVDIRTNERNDILQHAELLFGDAAVEKAWEKALDIKGKNS